MSSKIKDVINGPWPFVAPTPIGEGWGWGSRLIEIAFTPVGIVFWTCVWIGRGFMWIGERLFR